MRGRCRGRDRDMDRDMDRDRDRDRAATNDSNLCFKIQDHCQYLIYINFDKLIV